jgi:hypothetical protein
MGLIASDPFYHPAGSGFAFIRINLWQKRYIPQEQFAAKPGNPVNVIP